MMDARKVAEGGNAVVKKLYLFELRILLIGGI